MMIKSLTLHSTFFRQADSIRRFLRKTPYPQPQPKKNSEVFMMTPHFISHSFLPKKIMGANFKGIVIDN
jgi:hypothetical protein